MRELLNKRCHQLAEDRLQLLGCVKIAGLAERIALSVVAELRVIKRQFHIAREREWTLIPNLVVQQLEKVRILRHVAIITDDGVAGLTKTHAWRRFGEFRELWPIR